MQYVKSVEEINHMTKSRLRNYLFTTLERLVYADKERSRFQCLSQGLTSLKNMYSSQSKRFKQSNIRMASMQRQLYKYKRAEMFKIPVVPELKKARPNKRIRAANKRRALSSVSSSPISTASFGSDTPSVFSSSPSIIGSPVYYNSPRLNLEARINALSTLETNSNLTYEGTPNPYKYWDQFYSASSSPVVDLDA